LEARCLLIHVTASIALLAVLFPVLEVWVFVSQALLDVHIVFTVCSTIRIPPFGPVICASMPASALGEFDEVHWTFYALEVLILVWLNFNIFRKDNSDNPDRRPND
jgi:hypothetical protein